MGQGDARVALLNKESSIPSDLDSCDKRSGMGPFHHYPQFSELPGKYDATSPAGCAGSCVVGGGQLGSQPGRPSTLSRRGSSARAPCLRRVFSEKSQVWVETGREVRCSKNRENENNFEASSDCHGLSCARSNIAEPGGM